MNCPICGSEMGEGFLKCISCEADLIADKPLLQKEKGAYTSFIKRFIAILIDLAIYLFIIMPIVNKIVFPVFYEVLYNIYGYLAVRYALIAMSLIVFWLYNALLESSKLKGTIGKLIMKISVVNYDGQRITFLKATLRVFAKAFLSTLLFCYGFLQATYTNRNQALHDAITKTLVINSGREADLLLFKDMSIEI
jgi:uncharacterized RDD family membrane protein YckC